MSKLSIRTTVTAFCLCTAVFMNKTMAQTVIASGDCADYGTLPYELTDNGILTIRGDGRMGDFQYACAQQWKHHLQRPFCPRGICILYSRDSA